jgi:hypothetical protein
MGPKTKIIVFSIAVIVLLCALLSLQFLRGESEIALFVTGNTEGYLIPCGCRTSPAGGLSRRITIMNEIKAENPSRRVIPVELPNIFMDRGPAKEIINRTLGDFLTRNDYLVSIGARDLDLSGKLKEYVKGSCYLSGVDGFKSETVIELGGYKYLPFGKKGRLHLLFLSELDAGKGFKPPLTLFREKIKEAPQDSYIILGNISPVSVQDMVKEKADLLAVVATWGNSVTSMPQKADKTWAIFQGDKGRRYTLLEIGYFDGRWEVWPRTEYIDKNLAPDAGEETLVRKTLEEADKINSLELEKTKVVPAKGEAFSGSGSCKKCHEKEYEIWLKTTHSSATKVLEIDNQQNNPSCLVCHSTGFGKGGYPGDKADFNGIGCESCHGAGEGHPPRRMTAAGKNSRNCGICHTKRDSPNFSEEVYIQLIDHWTKKDKR